MRFITTVPTASMPSGLERLDSKYITRVMQSVGLPQNPNGDRPHPARSGATPSRASRLKARINATPERRTHREARASAEDWWNCVKLNLIEPRAPAAEEIDQERQPY